jgi:hypothetical protein
VAGERDRLTDGVSVVIDIGDVIGAIVLYTPDRLDGDEIEVWPEGWTSPMTHAAVRSWQVGRDRRFAAVFPALEAGEYTLRSVQDPAAAPRTMSVRGGQVTEENW